MSTAQIVGYLLNVFSSQLKDGCPGETALTHIAAASYRQLLDDNHQHEAIQAIIQHDLFYSKSEAFKQLREGNASLSWTTRAAVYTPIQWHV